MKYPLEKTILFLDVLKHTLLFLLRRTFLKSKKIDLIIVDMDGTLTSTRTFLEAINYCFKKKSKKIYMGTIFQNGQNNLTMDNKRMLKAVEYLRQGNFQKKYEELIYQKAMKHINWHLVDFLQTYPKKEIIVISKSSEWGASKIAKTLKLSAGFGSTLTFDHKGNLMGAQKLVTDVIPNGYNNTFTTKEMIAKKYMESKGKVFDLQRTALITNDILDLDLMSKVGLAIIVENDKPEFLEKLALSFRLYDLKFNKMEPLLKKLIE